MADPRIRETTAVAEAEANRLAIGLSAVTDTVQAVRFVRMADIGKNLRSTAALRTMF